MKHFTELGKYCLCPIVDPLMIIHTFQEIINKKYSHLMDDEFLQHFQKIERAISKIYDLYYENQKIENPSIRV